MPEVGKKKFPYDKKGMQEAAEYAKQTGKPLVKKPPKKKVGK